MTIRTYETQAPVMPPTAYCVLGLLGSGPMSGYDLKQLADQSISHFYWSPARSQIYSELRRLAASGMVTEERIEQETRPDKRVYEMTPRGRAALKAWLEQDDPEPDTSKNSTLLRVFFGREMDPQALIRMLRAKLEEVRLVHRRLADIHATVQHDDQRFYSALTIRAGLLHTAANMAWAEEALQKIEERERLHPSSAGGPAQ
jgi:DNA-binding PadR family transcriptional regulator